jgi:hypothetical protein
MSTPALKLFVSLEKINDALHIWGGGIFIDLINANIVQHLIDEGVSRDSLIDWVVISLPIAVFVTRRHGLLT